MADSFTLQEGQGIDENLRPVRLNGENTSLEIASDENGAKVKGDLEVTGDLKCTIDKIVSTGTGGLEIQSNSGIKINTVSGRFNMEYDGVAFSPENSAYAGMILGYTEMAYGSTSGRYDLTSSFVVLNDNYDHGDGAEDHFLGVTFTVPPSNKVEIEAYLPYVAQIDGTFSMGLATDTSASTLDAKYEVVAWDVDESDTVQVVQRWYIDGSDHSWASGESKTLYCTVKENLTGGRIFWGDGFINYGAMTMKATALPTTIGDGT